MTPKTLAALLAAIGGPVTAVTTNAHGQAALALLATTLGGWAYAAFERWADSRDKTAMGDAAKLIEEAESWRTIAEKAMAVLEKPS